MDLRSHGMRSKLLSLYLINSTLKSYAHIFSSHAPVLFVDGESDCLFIYAVRQFLCLAFTRNIISACPAVFQLCIECFGGILENLRHLLKREVSVMLNHILFPIIEARQKATFQQRLNALTGLTKCFSGRILVELYLNYDCDPSGALDENVWERLLSSISSVVTNNVGFEETGESGIEFQPLGDTPLTSAHLTAYTSYQIREINSINGDSKLLKKNALKLLVNAILQPLVKWIDPPSTTVSPKVQKPKKNRSNDRKLPETFENNLKGVSDETDDVNTFSSQKQQKTALLEGIKRFNYKYRKGIKYLLETGCIKSSNPTDIAQFLFKTEDLDKKMLGEYLGDGDEASISIMHAFFDQISFKQLSFTDALRHLLQYFRLPGEAQKIDRMMLKFASRFTAENPSSFSSADTAYVLAYSVIMLNTDLHNPQVKKRMTLNDFIINNRGIDGGSDPDRILLENIYREISKKEIILKEEHEKHSSKLIYSSTSNLNDNTSQKKRRDQDLIKSIDEKLINMREKLVWTAGTQTEHVKSMFQHGWMSILMSLSTTLSKSTQIEHIVTALEGFKAATHIACKFNLLLEKNAFGIIVDFNLLVTNLAKFTVLNSLQTCSMKEIECIKMLLEIAYYDGSSFTSEEWTLVIDSISALDKIQQDELVMEKNEKINKHAILMHGEISSQQITLGVDRIFSSSHKLGYDSILGLVTALCKRSWDEIITSPNSPRMYCLQRLVEIGHYNMNRIRVHWSAIWAVIGPHIEQILTHQNTSVSYFALDKLRQLASKFLEIEELGNFSFQKEFLHPFTCGVEAGDKVSEMSLTCLSQIVLSKASRLKSGWRSVLKACFLGSNNENGEKSF